MQAYWSFFLEFFHDGKQSNRNYHELLPEYKIRTGHLRNTSTTVRHFSETDNSADISILVQLVSKNLLSKEMHNFTRL
jgi:hypothetical protein